MSEQQAMMSEQTVLWSDKLQVAVKKLFSSLGSHQLLVTPGKLTTQEGETTTSLATRVEGITLLPLASSRKLNRNALQGRN